MFLVFAWKTFEALGGLSDLIDGFESLDDAELFCRKLQDSDSRFEYQISDEFLEIISESGSDGNPFLKRQKFISN
jgi:hypothetical protein